MDLFLIKKINKKKMAAILKNRPNIGENVPSGHFERLLACYNHHKREDTYLGLLSYNAILCLCFTASSVIPSNERCQTDDW